MAKTFQKGDLVWAISGGWSADDPFIGPKGSDGWSDAMCEPRQEYAATVVSVEGGGEYHVFESRPEDGGPEYSDDDFGRVLPARRLKARTFEGRTRAFGALSADEKHDLAEAETMRQEMASGRSGSRKAKPTGGLDQRVYQKDVFASDGRFYIEGTDKWFSTRERAEAWLAKHGG